ncbi:MAG TPA: SLBB domain-containing protein [Candidatus Limnocylindria bacterium]|nr:SLBB domain-containing protein [Candidatus Limnocylindria bacterium]
MKLLNSFISGIFGQERVSRAVEAMKIELKSASSRNAEMVRTGTCKKAFHHAASPFFVLAAVSCFCLLAEAQEQRPAPLASSELGRENLRRVAASAGELKLVLLKDAGLLVELKRWAAKEATDHGQIVGDRDLTNDAIFRRLEEDVQFRSVATQLVQKYGYLVPVLNPESDAGKERALLVQERVKWLAQHTEEERTQTHRRNQQSLQNTRNCDAEIEQDCDASQVRKGQASGSQGLDDGQPPARADREGQNPRSAPRDDSNPVEQPQLMQTGDSASGFLPSVPGGAGEANLPARSIDVIFEAPALSLSEVNGRDMAWGTSRGVSQPVSGPPFNQGPQTGPEAEEIVPKPRPYEDIPSIYDMYLQAVTRPATPRRFGIDVFTKGTRDAQQIPMDMPAGPDYVVGPGDGLSFDLWGSTSRRLTRIVDREGRVSLPEVGPILVSGKSLMDVQNDVQKILRTQFRDVSADVSLARLRSIRVYEVGDLVNPGAYDIGSLSTPLNALFAAGGPTARGSLRVVKHYRGNQLVQVVDVYDLLLHGVRSNMERLENGDTILAPPIGAQVTVEGMVRRPAIYELGDEKNLASVLELAGGLLPTAALRHIEVERTLEHEKQTMLSLDIPEASATAGVAEKLESFEIQDGDRIRIFPIAPYNQDAIYLEGHVIRPGRYSYRADMRVTDVIPSYKDLLPEPAAQYAEIIRLNAPDFHPSVESFNLSAALENPAQAPTLQAMDTVRIFSRFDFETPPVVSVWGDVRQPGTYRTSGSIRLSDAVHLAGGLGLDAQTTDAQVFRAQPGGKMKILSVRLEQALAGNTADNILLEPRDRLLIHRSPEAVEPATVYVQGEVGNPGRFPLTTNMRAGDLIRAGGGIKPSADTQSADLTHFVRASETGQLRGQHENVAILGALAGDTSSDIPLHNGDVLTIRQLPGWNDLGASMALKGEVKHSGTYGIRPGERLSSVIDRAGGFQPDAYPYGAVLERTQVRELEAKAQDEMILRVKSVQTNLELMPETDAGQKQAKELALQQYRATLVQLTGNPPIGRVAIRISSRVDHWRNTPADIEVRAGDTLVIPKKPSYVMVTGQVFNPTAVSYRPGRSAKWYLGQSGGPTQMANKKAIFVVRADGSVIGASDSMWSGHSLNAVLEPGDTVVVPEKALGGGIQWQNIFTAVQVASSVATTVFIAMHY